MTIIVAKEGKELKITLEGRLDTLSAPDLEEKLDEVSEGAEKLIFDFAKLEYISSAGLRVLAGATDMMEERGGEMFIANANSEIREVFEITGFIDDLNLI